MFSPAFTDSDDGALDWPPLFCINHLETDRPRLHCQAHYLPFSTDFAPSAWTDSVTSDEDFENELMTMMTDSAPSDKDFEDELMTTSSHVVAQVENCTPLGEKSAPRQSSRARWTRIQQGEATKTLSKDLAKQEEQRSYLLAWVARKKKGKPFATSVEKQMLAGRLKMTIPQINNFFNNARKRFQKVSGGYVSWKKLVKSGCVDA